MSAPQVPNFLIVGMAKCGTSSLAQYLNQHPDIYISKHKEPRFITSQCGKFPEGGPKDHLVKQWYVQDWDKYLELFKNRTEKMQGEASADTLYFHEDSIPVVKQYFGEPKIIIVLRNPVKRAFSAYQHLIRDERETLSFKKGLQQEPQRIKENWELIYYYKNASLYHDCVKAYMRAFKNVKVILNEDLQKKPEATLKGIFEFLEVDATPEINTDTQYNISGKPSNQTLHNSLQEETLLRKVVRPFARLLLPSQEKRIAFVNRLNAKNLKRMQIPKDMEAKLYQEFKSDVLKTQELIGQDLSHWMKN